MSESIGQIRDAARLELGMDYRDSVARSWAIRCSTVLAKLEALERRLAITHDPDTGPAEDEIDRITLKLHKREEAMREAVALWNKCNSHDSDFAKVAQILEDGLK